jgi:spore coat protein A
VEKRFTVSGHFAADRKFKERVVHKIQRALVAVAAAGGLAFAFSASAQVGFTKLNKDPKAANAAFPLQNPLGPSGSNYQVNYPYPGQCVASPANQALFPTLPLCDSLPSSSFTCEAGNGVSQRSAGGWAGCGAPSAFPFKTLLPLLPGPAVAAGGVVTVPATPKFVWEVLNPPDYTPDSLYAGADYYEIGLHEATGFQGLAAVGLFPNAGSLGLRCKDAAGAAVACTVPSGMQWTGLTCRIAGGCACPADASTQFKASNCTFAGKIPAGNPLFTPIWGVGQINKGGGPVTGVLSSLGKCAVTVAKTCVAGAVAPSPFACPVVVATGLPETCNIFAPPLFAPGVPAPWSKNDYVATWPSISIRGTTGKPVVVKWVNEFPNTHVLCPHPEAADWPCAIDRTFMGVKATIDPALGGPATAVPPDGVNQYGSPQQPDNSWVTHLHGGEIPPSTDGFAMKWFGNAVTAAKYDGVGKNSLMPPFENPTNLALKRPHGNFDVYAYPIIQEEATIWFHDHSIGKTHHNVIAGPAGFFPVRDPAKHGSVPAALRWIGDGARPLPKGSEYTWLDPVTEPRDALGIPKYDLFLAVQDRSFNEDGSINFSNGLAQTPLAPPPAGLGALGQTPVTAGVNPLVHPVWVPEYFGDHALVNGVLWPKKTVETGWYRLRIVNGSDSRCYTYGFLSTAANAPAPAPNTNLVGNQLFYVIANDQGYLQRPVRTASVTMCPGERYELLVDFGNLQGRGMTAFSNANVYLVNNAPAPFPAGFPPFAGALGASPWPDLNVIMRFDVRTPTAANGLGRGVRGCAMAGAPQFLTWDATKPWTANMATACMPKQPENVLDASFVRITGPAPVGKPNIIRQVYLNERIDGVTLMPLGMQLNGVPFEYRVTETPNFGTREVWKFINLTVDTHPMHPHLVKHQIVNRQGLDVLGFKTDLCGAGTCQPGPSPGNEMSVVPNVDGLSALGVAFLIGLPVAPAPFESGWKDVVQVPPAMVTTIVADWTPRWLGAGVGTAANPVGAPTAPGSVGNPINPAALPGSCPTTACTAAPWTYEAVTAGPYVWHCHINSHEDSEMMRTSLVVPVN